MSDEQKTTQEKPRDPFAGMPFAAMMKKMMGQQGQGCGCIEMMSQMMGQQDMDCDCAAPGVMSQMMAMCGGAQNEEEKTTAEATQEA